MITISLSYLFICLALAFVCGLLLGNMRFED